MFFLLLFSFCLCKSQYIQNKEKNDYFYKLIKNKKKKKKILHVFYNNNIHDIALWDSSKYSIENKYIANKGEMKYLFNKKDSLIILQYLQQNDSNYYYIKLFDTLKNSKAVAYNYSNPKKIYKNDSIYIENFYEPICNEFRILNKSADLNGCKGWADPDTQYYGLFLEAEFKHRKIIALKTRGLIIYYNFYDAINQSYLGLAGLCCFIFK